MRILFDTNVILDELLRREGFAEPAARLSGAVESGRLEGCVCATTLTTIDYLTKKTTGREAAAISIRRLIVLFEVAVVDRAVIETALGNEMTDFEDAVLYESARRFGAAGVVTRNERDFRQCNLRIYSPT